MRYLGGKTRIAKRLAAVIDRTRRRGQRAWAPFCGGLSMSTALLSGGPVRSTDANPALIAMYAAVQLGWDPPESVSEADYGGARNLPDSDPMKAFCGFCAAFGGKYFGGYARGEGRNWAAEGRRSLLRDLPRLAPVECVDFLACAPGATPDILYLDPPYAGTTAYAGAPSFDSSAFAVRCEEWSLHTDVFVSEYAFPVGRCVWEHTQLKRAGVGPGASATERLYHLPRRMPRIYSHAPVGAKERRETHMAVAKKKTATPGKPRVSALAAAVAAASPEGERDPLFDLPEGGGAAEYPCTFQGFARQEIVPGRKEWARATFQVDGEDGQRVQLFCIDSQSLASSGPRIKSMAMAIIGCSDEEEYNAFDPHGQFIDGLLGDLESFEAGGGMGTVTPNDYVGAKVVAVVTRGGAVGDSGDFYRNATFRPGEAE